MSQRCWLACPWSPGFFMGPFDAPTNNSCRAEAVSFSFSPYIQGLKNACSSIATPVLVVSNLDWVRRQSLVQAFAYPRISGKKVLCKATLRCVGWI